MEPAARVIRFIDDYATAHREFVSSPTRFRIPPGRLLKAWIEECEDLGARHTTGDVLGRLGYFDDTRPEFSPGTTSVESVEIVGDAALVKVNRRGSREPFVEFTLVQFEGNWLISDVIGFAKEPDLPIMDAAAAIASAKGERFASLRRDDRRDPGMLFVPGKVFMPTWEDGNKPCGLDVESLAMRVVVESLGSFSVHGHVAAGDWTDYEMVRVLNCPVTPTTVRTERSVVSEESTVAAGRVAGLRAVLSDEPTVVWRRALSGENNDHVLPVDGGMVGIFDASRYLGMTLRQWKSAQRHLGERTTGNPFEGMGVTTQSGWGDGSYGAYWGLGTSGEPTQLVIDFEVVY